MSLSKLPATALAAGAAKSNFGAGAVLQVIQTVMTTSQILSVTSLTNISGYNATITPSSTTSKILVMVKCYIGSRSAANILVGLDTTRNGTVIAVGDAVANYKQLSAAGLRSSADTNSAVAATWDFLDSPSTTSPVTYQVRGFCESGSWTFNGLGSDAASSIWSGKPISSITLMEIAG